MPKVASISLANFARLTQMARKWQFDLYKFSNFQADENKGFPIFKQMRMGWGAVKEQLSDTSPICPKFAIHHNYAPRTIYM